MDFHYKKDGSLDMRYSSSKAAMSSGFGGGTFGYSGGASYAPASFGSSSYSGLHHKKDGTLDMRYSSSRAAASSSSMQSNQVNRPPSSSGLHQKKDGSLDMRYSSSRAAASSSSMQSNQISRPPSSSGLHHKKDGSLDMRYASSKASAASMHVSQANRPPSSSERHYKKDGTLDMRYTSSKTTKSAHGSGCTSANYGIPSHIPVTRNGVPDMRTTAAKEWVKQQAQTGTNNVPSWVPRTKDGSPDMSKAITQEFLKWKDAPSTNYTADQRLSYYLQKLEDILFRNLVENAREEDVEFPQYEILPETSEIQRQLSRGSAGSYLRQDDDSADQYGEVYETPTSQRHSVSRTTRSSGRRDDDYDIRSEISESVRAIEYQDIRINTDDKLGQGSFGTVYKGIWNKQMVAVKQLHLNKLTRQEKNSFVKEIRIMSTLGSHPNLVPLYGYTLKPLCLVMEYVELGSLNHLLHYCEDPEVEAKITDGRIKKKLILGIVLGMNQLHAACIVHGDLKPQNVLVSKDYTAKVTDFGLATLRGKTSSSIASSAVADDGSVVAGGTAGYMAPELLDSSNPPEYSSDVYSFGIMLNEVIQEEEPYADQFRNFIGRGPFAAANYAKLGNRPSVSDKTSTFLRNFIEKCWNRHARRRPTFEQIFKELQPKHVNFPDPFDL